MESEQTQNFEIQRLKSLESYHVLKSHKESSFDHLATLATIVCQTPIALISFIDQEMQWVKSSIGIDLHQLPRSLSACHESILKNDYFVVEGSDFDLNLPFTEQMKRLGIHFYGGVPITTNEGFNVGTLCVLDYVPRELSLEQVESLKLISRQVMSLLEIRNNYHDTLEHLKSSGEMNLKSDHYLEDIAHKSSMRAIAELSAGLSYRIKTQMIVIENVSSRISKVKMISEKEFLSGLELLKSSVGNVNFLLNRLDTFVLAEKEKWMKPLVVNLALKGVLKHLDIKLKSERIFCDIQEDEKDLICIGNVTQISQVIYAVVNNAMEALTSSVEKRMLIKIGRDGHQGHVDISDTGPGIDEEVRSFIFQPFFSTKSSSSIGIGLSLAQSLMHRHGGSVEVTNIRNPTTFRISFPVP
jgi:signal transduction histidine kinase